MALSWRQTDSVRFENADRRTDSDTLPAACTAYWLTIGAVEQAPLERVRLERAELVGVKVSGYVAQLACGAGNAGEVRSRLATVAVPLLGVLKVLSGKFLDRPEALQRSFAEVAQSSPSQQPPTPLPGLGVALLAQYWRRPPIKK